MLCNAFEALRLSIDLLDQPFLLNSQTVPEFPQLRCLFIVWRVLWKSKSQRLRIDRRAPLTRNGNLLQLAVKDNRKRHSGARLIGRIGHQLLIDSEDYSKAGF